jgi:hypothetical protein
MARRETTTCDTCGAEISREHVHLRIYWMRELFKEPKDFCNLLCVQRWIESPGPVPLP